jgi:N-acetylmuramic acid 6-phosphate etherase
MTRRAERDGRPGERRRAPREPRLPSTEAVLDDTSDLDRASAAEIVAAIHGEDRRAVQAVGAVREEVARAVDALVAVLSGGGRWFYVGAGTSGRLGCADAAELPPTFGFDPERVVGVIAGGPEALSRAIEGAEDDAEGARRELLGHGLSPGDAVVAISASGCTPFALAALDLAQEVGARRIAITCDPVSPLAAAAEIAIAPDTGPEVIAGSTRMKGGLAQRMVLNQLSTAVMVRLGRVESNRMTWLRPGSSKLLRRAVGLVAELGGVDEARARALLERAGGSVTDALELLRMRRPQPSSSSRGKGPS